MKVPHAIPFQEVIAQLNSVDKTGLSREDVQQRLQQYGLNEIVKEEHQKGWQIFLRQFKSPMVYLLLFAAGMSFYFKEWLDGGAILIVILINACIGFYMEFQAGRSMEALQKLSSVPAKVLRNEKLQEIDAAQVVPGDILFLEAGDMVPADGRITRLSQFQVNESALTGESLPVDKITEVLAETTPLAEQDNMIFKGTFITKGNAWVVVTSTGMQTELGKIANLVQGAEQSATPLEKKLQAFSNRLIKITVALVAIIFISGWMLGQKVFEMLETSIALAVAAIPEGLGIVATLALARGMLNMAKHNVIVKKLSAVETLGGTNVICTDKTGTLTENKMTVKTIISPLPQSGNIRMRMIDACILCNTAALDEGGKEIGDPLETALLKYAQELESISDARSRFPKTNEEPFSSESKRMLTVHKTGSGYITFAKGAVEEILKISDRSDHHAESDFSAQLKEHYLGEAEKMAASGYKVIALAYHPEDQSDVIPTDNFSFLGLVGLIDPPRAEVSQAIAECKAAGIKVMMITGDHPETAKEIAHQLGMMDSKDEPVVLGGLMKSYESLPELDKESWVNAHVFARVTPAQKLDLIKVLQERKLVVGMTGDGVNDAPALKKADIGIAMGLRGTQVAQDVADMVLKDDSFSSIVTTIRQGRIIFANIRKFVIFLLSCNLSELFAIAIAAVLNLHFQLFPLQILFINLITDVLPALALGMTPGNANIMHQPPRSADQPITGNAHWKAVFFYSFTICAVSLGAVLFSHYTMHTTEGWNPKLCNNILFFTIIGSQLLHVFNMNATSSNFFTSEVVRNKYVWYAIALCVLILILLYEIAPVRKCFLYTSYRFQIGALL
jgi:Ca2+-transporting ATPase